MSEHNTDRESNTSQASVSEPDRRGFLASTSGLAMGAGLVAGYGTFFSMAGRYLFPSQSGKAWMFVTPVSAMQPGDSLPFESPTGVKVMITRQANKVAGLEPSAEDFLALSSLCPHLGCRVHWEPHNDRFFCPCHNGVFDPAGNPVAGPPLSDGQHLPQYPLRVEGGLLYIELPAFSVGKQQGTLAAHDSRQSDSGELRGNA